ncbi:MAG: DUF1854 domain-containing protein [Planctomycetota bacterium]
MSAVQVAAGWRLERRADGGVDFVAADGKRHPDVDVRRGFPFSAPEGGVAVLAAGGAELVWIDSFADCDPPLAAILEAILAEREFMPRVERITSVTEGRPMEWNVITDRGPHRFSVAHPDDVSRQPDGGVILTDTDGIRYRIPPAAALDPRSHRLLERGL